MLNYAMKVLKKWSLVDMQSIAAPEKMSRDMTKQTSLTKVFAVCLMAR